MEGSGGGGIGSNLGGEGGVGSIGSSRKDQILSMTQMAGEAAVTSGGAAEPPPAKGKKPSLRPRSQR